jgi:hypothetical protein
MTKKHKRPASHCSSHDDSESSDIDNEDSRNESKLFKGQQELSFQQTQNQNGNNQSLAPAIVAEMDCNSTKDDNGDGNPYALGVRSYIKEHLSKKFSPLEGEVYADFAVLLSSYPCEHDLQVGACWWIEREIYDYSKEEEKDQHFHKATITSISSSQFTFEYDNEGKKIVKSQSIDIGLTRELASSTFMSYLRLIEWENIPQDTFDAKARKEYIKREDFLKSRPLKPMEKIDFYISHGWDDNGDMKYDMLKLLTQEFYCLNGRYPTFWIDKFCVQKHTDGETWQYVPLFMSMCDRIILLAGRAYPTRLWTLLEPFISFVNEKHVDRILLIPVEKKETNENVFIEFERLCISKCKTYSPNDDTYLKNLFIAGGQQRFERCMTSIAQTLLAHICALKGGLISRMNLTSAILPRIKSNSSPTQVFLSHDWGEDRQNHLKVAMINDALKNKGLSTWFDEERMHGDMIDRIIEGIDNTQSVAVFITKQYQDKVNGNNFLDYCHNEFRYTRNRNHLGPAKMIPIVMDSTVDKDPGEWKKAIGGALGGHLYIDFSDVNFMDSTSLNEKVDKLYNGIMELIAKPDHKNNSEMN